MRSAQVLRAPNPSIQPPTMPLAHDAGRCSADYTANHIQSTVRQSAQIQSASIICYFALKDRHKWAVSEKHIVTLECVARRSVVNARQSARDACKQGVTG